MLISLFSNQKESKMNHEDFSGVPQSGDDYEIDFAPHYVAILRGLADSIESGKEIGITGKIVSSQDNPGFFTYTVVTKKE